MEEQGVEWDLDENREDEEIDKIIVLKDLIA